LAKAFVLGLDSLCELGVSVPAADLHPAELDHQFGYLYRWLGSARRADYADPIADSAAIGFLPKTCLSAAAIRRIVETDLRSRAAAEARAQRMRTAAVSGWSPNSCATRPAHPAAPYASRAMAMACRMWMTLRSSLRCRADANKASAWRVWMLQGYIVGLP
jgi:hypothetical protein